MYSIQNKINKNEEQLDLQNQPNFYVHHKQLKVIIYLKNKIIIQQLAQTSFFIFSDKNKFRYFCVWLNEWKYFDNFIIITILLNTITLMFTDYRYRLGDEKQSEWRQSFQYYTELIFLIIFTLEFLIKTISMSFILSPNAYLRDVWNILDFIVVLSGIVSFIPGTFNVSAIRTIRILRPLRSINSIKGMKILVASLIESLPALGNVVLFLVFLIIMFGILALQLFSGVFEYRCRIGQAPDNGFWPADDSIRRLCNFSRNNCPQERFCGSMGDFGLPQNIKENYLDEFNYGYTNFDNILIAIFSIFQSLTTEGWSKIVLILIYAQEPWIVYSYFILLILIGSFFVVNLILAVINDSFVNEEQKIKEKYLAQERKKLRKENNQKHRKYFSEMMMKTNFTENQNSVKLQIYKEIQNNENEKKQEIQKVQKDIQYFRFVKISSQYMKKQKAYRRFQEIVQKVIELNKYKENLNIWKEEIKKKQKIKIKTKNTLQFLQNKIRNLAESRVFLIFTTLVIIANTIVLSLDKYPIDNAYENRLELFNIIFTYIFAYEMCIKIIAFGLKGYFKDSFNIFDCILVFLSVIEIIFQQSGLFVTIAGFRSLRLFRIIKLIKRLENLRFLLISIGKTLQQINNFLVLVILFIIVSSLLGMEFFAYKIRFKDDLVNLEDGESPDVNFDNFQNAFVCIFILLINENWNQILYYHLRAFGDWSPSIFFITVIIVGNFILLKLFLAILINQFSQNNNQQLLIKNQNNNNNKKKISKNKLNLPKNIKKILLIHQSKSKYIYIYIYIYKQIKKSNSSIFNKNQNKQSRFKSNLDQNQIQKIHLQGKSLNIFTEKSKLRIILSQVLFNKNFEYCSIIIIIISSIILCIDEPLQDPTSQKALLLNIIDIIITSIFLTECFIKIIVFGFFLNGKDSYIRNINNLLGFYNCSIIFGWFFRRNRKFTKSEGYKAFQSGKTFKNYLKE
ncbi:hypothetical protein IMG5_114650 [Ichthyophthirius multifiliis]|uniref:Ion transport domain-containing protein n=1 Tax=Ichthyophthirius multifiliis TaxID=5932 RepID=G0QU33_ICHMU|nr:hypothetical protein IMG5_114650 [Ichthyophthirius multifiliis]EGR31257.1 hypothetical protein IMG5_114650 [Ichthyophthirius multifiliis]|eukprot:XP_004034743.1 hypothetical protein IMG5_114650 [Ichthyophthirius multifiliis]